MDFLLHFTKPEHGCGSGIRGRRARTGSRIILALQVRTVPWANGERAVGSEVWSGDRRHGLGGGAHVRRLVYPLSVKLGVWPSGFLVLRQPIERLETIGEGESRSRRGIRCSGVGG